jgi:hypothetical protein
MSPRPCSAEIEPFRLAVARNTLIRNLHINIVAKDWDPKVEKTIEPWIYEATGKPSLGFLPLATMLMCRLPGRTKGHVS